ncbi:hypothetical protein [Bradyrhizobium sp. HKCCYLS20291]|uniref:hypothetical protein n=1 Tax=Bradyrhizobium sp. HKCCYLS20291 TaxID=3420766 RepID=UPI003EBA040D
MTIVRREHKAQFTIVPNAVFADSRLSVEAKGVLGYLLSRPHKWHVRLDHIGRTLLVGRKKLQRIFRVLIAAGYVTREAQRIVDGHRFGEIDYVVRDVPAPVDKSARPRGRKGPAAPRVQKGPAYKDSPRGPEGPAYKELYKNRSDQARAWSTEWRANPVKTAQDRLQDDDARLDPGIVQLFDDVAEGGKCLPSFRTKNELTCGNAIDEVNSTDWRSLSSANGIGVCWGALMAGASDRCCGARMP